MNIRRITKTILRRATTTAVITGAVMATAFGIGALGFENAGNPAKGGSLPFFGVLESISPILESNAATIYNGDGITHSGTIEANPLGDNVEMTSYNNWPGDFTASGLSSYPLDAVSDAAVAYSLRKLSSSYKGALVKIRRSSDNQLMDFYPDGSGRLSLSSKNGGQITLGDWIGNNDGYVHTWYDQSGKGKNAVQSSANIQPLVVNEGVVEGGKTSPSIMFRGSKYIPFDGSVIVGKDYSVAVVNARAVAGNSGYYLRGTKGGVNLNAHLGYRHSNILTHAQYSNDYDISVSSTATGKEEVHFYRHSQNIGKNTYINGVLRGSKNDKRNLEGWEGSSIGGSGYFFGNISEIIMYARYISDEERGKVEGSQFGYYQINDIDQHISMADNYYWNKFSQPVSNMENPVLVPTKEKIYVFAGTGKYYTYSPSQDKWDLKYSPSISEPDKSWSGTESSDEKIYVMNKLGMMIIDKFGQIDNNAVETREYASLVSVGRKLYLIGGTGGNLAVKIYNTETGQWSTSSTSYDTKGQYGFNIGGKIYLFGGEDNDGNKYTKIRVLNVRTMNINEGSEIPFAMSRINVDSTWQATALNGKIYFRNAGTTYTYTPSLNRWDLIEYTEDFKDLSKWKNINGQIALDEGNAIKIGSSGASALLGAKYDDLVMDFTVNYTGDIAYVPFRASEKFTDKYYLEITSENISLKTNSSEGYSNSITLGQTTRSLTTGEHKYNVMALGDSVSVWENGNPVIAANSTPVIYGFAGVGGASNKVSFTEFHIQRTNLNGYAGDELIKNGKLDMNLDNWSVKPESVSGSVYIMTGKVHFEGIESIPVMTVEQEVNLNGAKQIYFTGDIETSKIDGAAYINITWNNGTSIISNQDVVSVSGDAVRNSGMFINVPSGANKAIIKLGAKNVTKGYVEFDNISIRKVEPTNNSNTAISTGKEGFTASNGWLYQIGGSSTEASKANVKFQSPVSAGLIESFILGGGNVIWVGGNNPFTRVKANNGMILSKPDSFVGIDYLGSEATKKTTLTIGGEQYGISENWSSDLGVPSESTDISLSEVYSELSVGEGINVQWNKMKMAPSGLDIDYDFDVGVEGNRVRNTANENSDGIINKIAYHTSEPYPHDAVVVARKVTKYSLTSSRDNLQNDPKDWRLQASNDMVTWVDLDTQTGQTFSGRMVTNTYDIGNTLEYKHYRLNITDINGATSRPFIGEFTLYDGDVQLSGPDKVISSSNKKDEGVIRDARNWRNSAYDDDPYSLWTSPSTDKTVELTYTFIDPVANAVAKRVTKYSVMSADNEPARDPKDWVLQGSNDGLTWLDLDTKTGQTFSKHWETKEYEISNNDTYKVYRLNITANNGAVDLHVGELSLFDGDTKISGVGKGVIRANEISNQHNHVSSFAAFDGINDTKWYRESSTGWISFMPIDDDSKALYFSDNWIDVDTSMRGNNYTHDFSKGLSFEIMFNPTYPEYSKLFFFQNSTDGKYIFIRRNNNESRFYFQIIGNETETVWFNDFFNVNDWIHMIVTIDIEGNLKLYKDGEKIYETTGIEVSPSFTTDINRIGDTERYPGYMRHFRKYGKALTEDEVLSAYENKYAWNDISQTGGSFNFKTKFDSPGADLTAYAEGVIESSEKQKAVLKVATSNDVRVMLNGVFVVGDLKQGSIVDLKEGINNVILHVDGKADVWSANLTLNKISPQAVKSSAYKQFSASTGKNKVVVSNWSYKKVKDGLIADIDFNDFDPKTGKIVDKAKGASDTVVIKTSHINDGPKGYSVGFNYAQDINYGQYADVGGERFGNFSNGLTLQMTIRTQSPSANKETFFETGNAEGEKLSFYREAGTRNIVFDTGTTMKVENATVDGIWSTYILTIDALGNAKVYIDGKLVNTGKMDLPKNVNRTYGYIAKSSAGDYFRGWVQNVRIYNRALEALEVLDDYNELSNPVEFETSGWNKDPKNMTINLGQVFNDGGVNKVAYAQTKIFSSVTQGAKLTVNSSGNNTVWVNGKLIGLNPEDKEIGLLRGLNSIFVRSESGDGEWKLSVQVIGEGNDGRNIKIREGGPNGEDISGTIPRNWLVLGPFDLVRNFSNWADSDMLLQRINSPETEGSISPSVGDVTEGKTWIEAQMARVDNFVHVGRALELSGIEAADQDWKTVYAFTKIYSDDYQDVTFEWGKWQSRRNNIWVNGKLVWSLTGDDPGIPQKINVRLNKGENTILVKSLLKGFFLTIKPDNMAPAYLSEVKNSPEGSLTVLRDTGRDAGAESVKNEVVKTIKNIENKVVYTPSGFYFRNYGDERYSQEQLRDYLVERGFVNKDGDQLKDWMVGKLASKSAGGTVVVMNANSIPVNILENLDQNSTFRKYLDAGGKIVWRYGAPARYYTYYSGLWWHDFVKLNEILGIKYLEQIEGGSGSIATFISDPSSPSAKIVSNMGINDTYSSFWSLDPLAADEGIVVPLALRQDGRISAWMKNYNSKYPKSGFVRLYDGWAKSTTRNEGTYENIYKVAIHGIDNYYYYESAEKLASVDTLKDDLNAENFKNISSEGIVRIASTNQEEVNTSVVFATDLMAEGTMKANPYKVSEDRATLFWKDNSIGTNAYRVIRTDELGKSQEVLVPSNQWAVAGRGYNVDFSGLSYDTYYDLKVIPTYVSDTEPSAQTGDGESYDLVLKTLSLLPPSNIKAENTENNSVILSWEDNSQKESSYNVYINEKFYKKIPSTSKEQVGKHYELMINLSYGETHTIGVSTVDEDAIEGDQGVVKIKVRPDKPVLKVSSMGNLGSGFSTEGRGYVVLSWKPVLGAESYEVYIHDGYDYKKVDEVTTSNWDSRVAKVYPSEDEIKSYVYNYETSIFREVGTGLDLRDTPNNLYKKSNSLLYLTSNKYNFVVYAKNTTGKSEMSKPLEVEIKRITDNTPPTGRIVINDGTSTKTMNRVVLLKVEELKDDISGVQKIEYSEDKINWFAQDKVKLEHGSDSSWTGFPPERFTLSEELGTKKVFARLTDMAGNSSIISGSIELVTDRVLQKLTLSLQDISSENFALKKFVDASSKRYAANERVSNATDGDLNTVYASNWVRDNNQYLYCDLGEQKTFNVLRVKWGVGDFTYYTNAGRNYRYYQNSPSALDVLTSNEGDFEAGNWTTIKADFIPAANNNPSNDMDVIVLPDDATARYVRLNFDRPKSDQIQLGELELYYSNKKDVSNSVSKTDKVIITPALSGEVNSEYKIRYSNDRDTWSKWYSLNLQESMLWELSDWDGTKTIFAEVLDDLGRTISASIKVVRNSTDFADFEGRIMIDKADKNIKEIQSNGINYFVTRDKSMNITLPMILENVPETSRMSVSLDGYNWSQVEPVRPYLTVDGGFGVIRKSVSFIGGDGWHQIMIKVFKDENDTLPYVTEPQRILVDSKAPEVVLRTTSGSNATSNSSLDVFVDVTDISNNFEYSINDSARKTLPDNRVITINNIKKGLNNILITVFDDAGNAKRSQMAVWGLGQ